MDVYRNKNFENGADTNKKATEDELYGRFNLCGVGVRSCCVCRLDGSIWIRLALPGRKGLGAWIGRFTGVAAAAGVAGSWISGTSPSTLRWVGTLASSSFTPKMFTSAQNYALKIATLKWWQSLEKRQSRGRFLCNASHPGSFYADRSMPFARFWGSYVDWDLTRTQVRRKDWLAASK